MCTVNLFWVWKYGSNHIKSGDYHLESKKPLNTLWDKVSSNRLTGPADSLLHEVRVKLPLPRHYYELKFTGSTGDKWYIGLTYGIGRILYFRWKDVFLQPAQDVSALSMFAMKV